MKSETFSSLEAIFLTKFNEGHKTFESLKNNVPFNEKTLQNIIESMIAKNVIKFNTSSKEYSYDTPVNGEVVILEGNVMLPVTIIKTKTKTLVSRGAWYEFPLDFDVRRIIWNVQLPNNNRSTLVDLIQNSILKEKKSKIIQLPEYVSLCNKLIPYNDNIKLKINIVGEDLIDVNIIFVVKLKQNKNDDDYIEFRLFTVKTEIRTSELIAELTKNPEDRNYQNIQLNKIYNFSDFIFSGNSIPYSFDGSTLDYVTITSIRKKLELSHFSIDFNGKTTKNDVEEYTDPSEGIEKLRELFTDCAEKLLLNIDFLIEADE
jgi:hypothetical protein